MHADSIPPPSLVEQVHQTLADPPTVLGGFRVLITNPAGGLMRFQTAHHCAKTYYMPAIAKPISFYRQAPSHQFHHGLTHEDSAAQHGSPNRRSGPETLTLFAA